MASFEFSKKLLKALLKIFQAYDIFTLPLDTYHVKTRSLHPLKNNIMTLAKILNEIHLLKIYSKKHSFHANNSKYDLRQISARI